LPALKRIALVLAGMVLVAMVWIGGRSMMEEPGTDKVAGSRATKGSRSGETQATAPPAAAENPVRLESAHVRRIAPGSIAGPRIDGPLERVAPREALAPATRSLKREPFGPPIPQGTLLYRPVAAAAGAIAADGHDVRLAGIKVTPADRTCTDQAGKSWPCGTVARTALRAWMRGRAVACDVPSHPGEIVTHCTLDGEDMALWLVRNGWAESADGQYDQAEAKARRERKGMFGPSPLRAGEE
jgi:endonuclease YncB( thermonuclease family)